MSPFDESMEQLALYDAGPPNLSILESARNSSSEGPSTLDLFQTSDLCNKNSINLAKEILQRIDTGPTFPSHVGETWYGVDGKFLQKLEACVEALTESSLLHENSDAFLPPITNKRYVEGQFLKPKVTKRTPLKTSMIEQLSFVPSEIWSYIKSITEYDIEIPRSVVVSESETNPAFVVEKQPIRLWIVPANGRHTKKGVHGTPVARYFSCEDLVEMLFQVASGEIGCTSEQVSLFKAPRKTQDKEKVDLLLTQWADHLGDFEAPPKEKDVSSWSQINWDDRKNTLKAEGLDGPIVIHVMNKQSTYPHVSELPQYEATDDLLPFSSPELRNKEDEDRNVILNQYQVNLGCGGLAGLQNLGNTCFMNSALQCLSHSMPLTEYFLSDQYESDLNVTNPLGMRGRLAKAYAEFLKEVWKGPVLNKSSAMRDNLCAQNVVVPRGLKQVIGQFAPQFIGYQQQDSHEFTAFLLDGLHEDLNKVLHKPYTEAVEGDDTKDNNSLANEAWKRHTARNNSFIVDTFQGQYRGRLECPVCGKVSVVFDPFMYLTLPLPNIQDFSAIISLFLPAAGSRVRGIKFGIKLSTKFTFFTFKQLIATKVLDIADKCFKELRMLERDISELGYVEDLITNRNKLQPVAQFFRNLLAADGNSVELMTITIIRSLLILRCRLNEMGHFYKCFDFLKEDSKIYPSTLLGHQYTSITEYIGILTYDQSITQIAEGRQKSFDHSDECETPESDFISHPDIIADSPNLSNPEIEDGISIFSRLSEKPSIRYSENRQNLPKKNESYLLMLIFVNKINNHDTYHLPTLHKVQNLTCKEAYQLAYEQKVFEGDDTSLIISTYNPSTKTLTDIPGISTTLFDYLVCRFGSFPTKGIVLYCTSHDNSPANVESLNHQNIEEMQQYHDHELHQRPVTLNQCLEEFLKEERLASDNMWYCNQCKEHRQAKKRIDIWRLPKILVIHLKRFSQTSRHYRSKNSTEVQLHPDQLLDLTQFIRPNRLRKLSETHKDAHYESDPNLHYALFGISNHMGSLIGGHYTATVKCRLDLQDDDGHTTPVWQWMNFDDTHAHTISSSEICGTSAYLLFYQRQDLVDKFYNIDQQT